MAADIKNIVKELLKKNPVVILPRLGGFTAEYVSAEVDPAKNTFNPPNKKIQFNPDLNSDGGLVYAYLQQNEGYTDVESKKVVSDFVQNVWRRLEHGLEEQFPNIGTLKLNKQKQIEFRPAPEENLLPDSYGFDSFKYAPKSDEPITPTRQTMKRPRFAKALILIIGIPLLLTYGIYYYLERDFVPFRSFFTNNQIQDFTEASEGNEDDLTAGEDSISNTLDEQTRPENALQYTEEQEPSQNQTEGDERYAGMSEFYVVAGSFNRYDNAQVLSQKLKNRGFNPTILDKYNGFYRVAIRSFDNRQLALQEFNALRSRFPDLKLWLLSM